MNYLLVTLGKKISYFLRLLKLGAGSTWPGHIALLINPYFIKEMFHNSKTEVVLIAGTNGKTTTTTLIRHVIEKTGKKIFQNESGSNLLNGISSSLITAADNSGKLHKDYALFEVDENTLPQLLKELTPSYLLILNLFRDQLDRYGEIHNTSNKWKKALRSLPSSTTLILNADDPEVFYLGEDTPAQVTYFGLAKKGEPGKNDHASDSIYCPRCQSRLIFSSVTFSHLGHWKCPTCKLQRPEKIHESAHFFPLVGEYNKYNTIAATLLLEKLEIDKRTIENSFKNFSPAFGRQEVIMYEGKKVQLFLSKNPTSFNQSYKTIKELGGKVLLIVLNDRIPDGHDVSWIWDIDIPDSNHFDRILISGDRVYDMALRLKYENFNNFQTFTDLSEGITAAVRSTTSNETLYVLPTYSAMLDVRKILTGRKIL